jgi:Fe2+ or Zn2+ uptake regulation protein
MYESLKDKTIKCKFCDFVGEFKYGWTDAAFTVICPSCGKVSYEVSREKIEALAQEIVKESIEDLKKSKDT